MHIKTTKQTEQKHGFAKIYDLQTTFFFISSLSKPQDIIILHFCFAKKKKRNGIGFITFSYCTFQHSRNKLQLMFKFKHIIFIFGFRCMSFAFYMHLTSTVITIIAPKECTNSSAYFTVWQVHSKYTSYLWFEEEALKCR